MGAIECIQSGIRARIVIQNAREHNCMNRTMWAQLEEIALRLAEDDNLKVVVVQGAGRQFSTGFDLEDWDGHDLDEAQAGLGQMERALTAVEGIPVPVIAAIRGTALGGGLALALSCDLRVADDTVRLGMPITGLGIATSEAFASRLVHAFGLGKTGQMLFLGECVRGPEALALGAIQGLTDRSGLDLAVEAWQSKIMSMPCQALRESKRVLSRTCRSDSAAPPSLLGQWALNAIQERFPSRS